MVPRGPDHHQIPDTDVRDRAQLGLGRKSEGIRLRLYVLGGAHRPLHRKAPGNKARNRVHQLQGQGRDTFRGFEGGRRTRA